jgi:hypothetical protein
VRKITKPDIGNTDPQYWEEVLESHGLGVKHLHLEEEDDDITIDELLISEAENE